MDNHFLAEVLAITKKRGSGRTPVISALQSGINIIDYDGSLVKHYTKEEFLALSAMPSNPSHTGLVAQGWNWTLADAKAYIQKYGSLIIGQMYTTDTGDTRIYIHIDKDTPQNRLTFYVRFTSSVANNVDIDWGDGTVETKGSTTATNYPHTYATGGDYIIKLKVNSGTISFSKDDSDTDGYNRGRINRVEIGNNVNDLGNYTFLGCYSLTYITIPSSIISIGISAFQNCYHLFGITIPNGINVIQGYTFYNCCSLAYISCPISIQRIGEHAFQNCYSLAAITINDSVTIIDVCLCQHCYSLAAFTIPDNVTNIKDFAFANCYSLTSMIIPEDVTIIGVYAFANCYGISEYHLLSTIPPTLSNVNVFDAIASDCKIYVPYSTDHSILAAYQSASNWSTYASRMVEEPHP